MFDAQKFENPLQLGGIRTGSLDYPNPCGGQSCRVAHFNTGSGLSFTVALDRGGDIVEATYNGHSLAYLSPNDYRPPSHSMHRGIDWLVGWPAGLVTTAGPVQIGEPAPGDTAGSLHGRHSNTPAAVLSVTNPDPARGELDMCLRMSIRDTRMFGPCLEVRREIVCRLGSSEITIRDEVRNLGDEPSPHSLLYHVNFGYPLLDEGTRFLYRGPARLYDFRKGEPAMPQADKAKQVPPADASFCGGGEQVVVADAQTGADGLAHTAIVNDQRQLAVELAWSPEALPRLANWLHFGPRGSYVAALEPFYGSLLDKSGDTHPSAGATLAPAESRSYELRLTVHSTRDAIDSLAEHDGPLELTHQRM